MTTNKRKEVRERGEKNHNNTKKGVLENGVIYGCVINHFLMKLCLGNQHWGPHETCKDFLDLTPGSCPRDQEYGWGMT